MFVEDLSKPRPNGKRRTPIGSIAAGVVPKSVQKFIESLRSGPGFPCSNDVPSGRTRAPRTRHRSGEKPEA